MFVDPGINAIIQEHDCLRFILSLVRISSKVPELLSFLLVIACPV